MRKSGRLALSILEGLDHERYRTDLLTRLAIERVLQNFGEALYQLEKLAPPLAARLPQHRTIIGFRHVLVHGYETVDHDRVWVTLVNDLPAVLIQLDSLLDELSGSESP